MFLMDYPTIIGEYFPDYAKNATWNLLHAYIDEHSRRLFYKYLGYGVHAITRFQSQCANMTFAKKENVIYGFRKLYRNEGNHQSIISKY